jgi:hypothetical protein
VNITLRQTFGKCIGHRGRASLPAACASLSFLKRSTRVADDWKFVGRCSQCSAPLLCFVLLEVLLYFLDHMPQAQRTMSDRELGSWRECTRIRAPRLEA